MIKLSERVRRVNDGREEQSASGNTPESERDERATVVTEDEVVVAQVM